MRFYNKCADNMRKICKEENGNWLLKAQNFAEWCFI